MLGLSGVTRMSRVRSLTARELPLSVEGYLVYCNTFKSFQVPIGKEKCVELFKFRIYSPILKYCLKSLNICCFSSLASAFAGINNNNAGNAISMRIE